MTFAEYWRQKGHFGGDPEEVAKLAWNAAIERCAEIAEEWPISAWMNNYEANVAAGIADKISTLWWIEESK